MNNLAFDTSGEFLSVALGLNLGGPLEKVLIYEGQGAAQASKQLLATIADLLNQVSVEIGVLDAITFGCGPGAFTGLRCAASCAQGLALGADLFVIPLSTLLATVESARLNHFKAITQAKVNVFLDARLGEFYFSTFEFCSSSNSNQVNWKELQSPQLITIKEVGILIQDNNCFHVGNIFNSNCSFFHPSFTQYENIYFAQPTAVAMLGLAQTQFKNMGALSPEEALPVYVRNQVAKTIEERIAEKQEKT